MNICNNKMERKGPLRAPATLLLILLLLLQPLTTTTTNTTTTTATTSTIIIMITVDVKTLVTTVGYGPPPGRHRPPRPVGKPPVRALRRPQAGPSGGGRRRRPRPSSRGRCGEVMLIPRGISMAVLIPILMLRLTPIQFQN